MKNKKVISSMLAVLSSFSQSTAVKKGVKMISKQGGQNVIRKFGSNKSILSGNQIRKARRKNKEKFSKLRHPVRNGALSSRLKYNSRGENASGFGSSPSSSAFKNSVKNEPVVSLSQSNSGKMNKKSKATIIPNVPNSVTISSGVTASLLGLGFGIYGFDRKFGIFEKMGLRSKPKESLEVDGITFGNFIDKQSYVDILNYLQNNIEAKCYEYQGKKYLFLELDLKDGSTLCVSRYLLKEDCASLCSTSFIVKNSEKGQVEKYFKIISDQIASQADIEEVPFFDNVEFLSNQNEIKTAQVKKDKSKYRYCDIEWMVSQILCKLEYKVGNIDLRHICGLALQERNQLLEKLSAGFAGKFTSDGVLESLFMPCFSAHKMSFEAQIDYKISKKIKVYSDEFDEIEDENKKKELIKKVKDLNIYEEG